MMATALSQSILKNTTNKGNALTVLSYYSSNARHYHGFAHVGGMLRTCDDVFADLMKQLNPFQIKALRSAIVYHDCIYLPGDIQNETKSAMAAYVELAREGYDERELNEVVRLIHLTVNHITTSSDVAGAIIIDLDLAELASDRYKRNSELLRKEFKKLNDEEWRSGRIKWLQSFLSRPQIYYTEYGLTNWEIPARSNMTSELDYLKELVNEAGSG